MEIAIIGYGKMGHMVEEVALERGHHILCHLDGNWQTADLAGADVAIEFTVPQAAPQNIQKAAQAQVPVVSGTTGWDVQALQRALPDITAIWASNYSIGVNLMFALNTCLAQLINNVNAQLSTLDDQRLTLNYAPSVTETHHIHKLDAPSGTARTLAEQIGNNCSAISDKNVPIRSIREGEVIGIHTVDWTNNEEVLSIRHEAFSRRAFATGAVLAAEWLKDKHGWHTFREVLTNTDSIR